MHFEKHWSSAFKQRIEEKLLRFFSSISDGSLIDINNLVRTNNRRIYLKWFMFFLLILFLYFYLYLYSSQNQENFRSVSEIPSTKLKAYIITANCISERFNVTKENIEHTFPNLFDIRCYLTIPLNDSRIHTGPTVLMKKFSSNLLAFIELWTYVIPKDTNNNDLQWSFIFEDDVNFNNPEKVQLINYVEALQEFMIYPEVRESHGFFYLGICGPAFLNDTPSIFSKITNNKLYSQKGSGFCIHASAITTRRARYFWTEISSYRPNLDLSLDKQLRDYSIRSNTFFYTFGSNFLFPPNTGHYGVAFQDRGRFSTTVA